MSEDDDLSLEPRSSFELRRQEGHELFENVPHAGRLLIQPLHASLDEVYDRASDGKGARRLVVHLLGRAHDGFVQLAAGGAQSAADIARNEGLTRS